MLKANSKKILDIIAGQESKNATKAYKQVHPNASDVTARTNVHQLLKKPESQIYLQKHINRATNRIVELVNSDKDEIALRASQDILDRTQGKAIQQVQTTSQSISVNIDLTTDTDTLQATE